MRQSPGESWLLVGKAPGGMAASLLSTTPSFHCPVRMMPNRVARRLPRLESAKTEEGQASGACLLTAI